MILKKRINIRNFIIIMLCATLICLGVGFSIVAIQLKKEKSNGCNYEVVFSELMKSSSVKGSEIEPSSDFKIISSGQIVDMNFTLNAPRDEITYIAVIKNEGSIPVEIVDLMTSPDYSDKNMQKLISPVTIKISDVKGKTIEPEENIEVKIVVYYNPSSATISKKSFNYQIGIISKAKAKS